MDHFAYRDGILQAEDVSLETIADAVGTPVFVYSAATIRRHYRVYAEAFSGLDALVCYAVKANGNIAVVNTLAKEGAGADVVSAGELTRALRAGVPADKIVFSGVAKGADEMAAALDAGILQINVESWPELERLNAVAVDKGVRAPVAIRVNPDVDAKTHAKITTGRAENKFGIDHDKAADIYHAARGMAGIDVGGIAVHIGSQLTDLAPYRTAYERVRALAEALRDDGHDIRRIDLGGGLGIPYGDDADGDSRIPSPADYGRMAAEVLDGLGCRILLEPGRLIVGNAGVLLSRVAYVKEGASRTFVILDAGMNDLIRPSLYDAFHAVVPVRKPADDAPARPVDIVGPVCETGDTFAKARAMGPVAAGDVVAFRSAGAYGAVMASMYNARALAPEVLVDGGRFTVVRDRVDIDRQLAWERLADEDAETVRDAAAG
jgi:diaminopimelate decarboxylase